MANKKARVIAFYLPQFHPIPENDKWWGKGFTEWTNVGKAKPLFKGHYQPRVPADLGYYDLRMPEVREAQAELAREAGIEGFCYWHYWFSHEKKLLERPFQEVLKSGNPNYPFCLGWANHSWTNKTWEVGTRKVAESNLMQMVYNEDEYRLHFYDVLPAFKDKRYITVDGCPLFLVWRPLDIPNPKSFIDLWQSLAKENGLKGIHFVGLDYSLRENEKTLKLAISKKDPGLAQQHVDEVINAGYNAVNMRGYHFAECMSRSFWDIIYRFAMIKIFKHSTVSKCDQRTINKYLYSDLERLENVYPTLMPNWDRSARSGRKARIYTNSTPEVFKEQIKQVINLVKNKDDEHKVVFLMSWNEWAEGNYVEPDLKYGHGFLCAIKEAIM